MKLTKKGIYLTLILALGLVLRTIAAHYTDIGTDEMLYSLVPFNILGSGILGTHIQSPLFAYLADVGYWLMGGITAISARLPSIVFGSLTSLVIFLISRQIFTSKKSALLSAFLFAVSGFAITRLVEMDMTAFFFAAMSMLFFARALKRNLINLVPSSLFLALGALAQPLVLIFGVCYIPVLFLHGWRENSIFLQQQGAVTFRKKPLKIILTCFLVFVLVTSPVLIYNYFTYTEEGTTDYYFSSILSIGKYPIGGVSSQNWNFPRFKSFLRQVIPLLLYKDTVLLIFGLFGGLFLFRKDKYIFAAFVLPPLLGAIYLGGKVGGTQHHLAIPIVLSLLAGEGIVQGCRYFSKLRVKHLIPLLLIIASVSSIFVIKDVMESRGDSITLVLREFTRENIPDNAIVAIDPRIFNGVHAWVFHDKHYVQGDGFLALLSEIGKTQAQTTNVPFYYVECIPDTNCGWKPEDFKRIFDVGEQVSSYFKKGTQKVGEVNVEHHFAIHAGSIEIPSEVYAIIDRSHSFWGCPVGWKYPEMAVDHYRPEGPAKLLNLFGLLILYIDLLFALATVPLVLYWTIRN